MPKKTKTKKVDLSKPLTRTENGCVYYLSHEVYVIDGLPEDFRATHGIEPVNGDKVRLISHCPDIPPGEKTSESDFVSVCRVEVEEAEMYQIPEAFLQPAELFGITVPEDEEDDEDEKDDTYKLLTLDDIVERIDTRNLTDEELKLLYQLFDLHYAIQSERKKAVKNKKYYIKKGYDYNGDYKYEIEEPEEWDAKKDPWETEEKDAVIEEILDEERKKAEEKALREEKVFLKKKKAEEEKRKKEIEEKRVKMEWVKKRGETWSYSDDRDSDDAVKDEEESLFEEKGKFTEKYGIDIIEDQLHELMNAWEITKKKTRYSKDKPKF